MTVTQSQESLLQIIERFNRKERYIVFQQVATTGEVHLDPGFREKLQRRGWPVPDQGVLVLTDYHLNWLYAALELHAGRWTSAGSALKHEDDVAWVAVPGPPPRRRALEPNQEDIDLLLVWEDGEQTHLGLVEAKAHSGWSNKQLRSKAARLEATLGRGTTGRYRGVTPHFALLSFTAPAKVDVSSWPDWMTGENGKEVHVTLDSPQTPRYVVGRVDRTGKSSSAGDYHRIWELGRGS